MKARAPMEDLPLGFPFGQDVHDAQNWRTDRKDDGRMAHMLSQSRCMCGLKKAIALLWGNISLFSSQSFGVCV